MVLGPAASHARSATFAAQGTTTSGTLLSGQSTFPGGQTVQTYAATYATGNVLVKLGSMGLTQGEFDAARNAFVDGRAHPDVVAHLQSEANASGSPDPH